LRESEAKFSQTVIQNSAGLNQLTTRLYREFYEMDEFSALTVEGLMLEIIAEFLRNAVKSSTNSIPKWLLLARDFINEEFHNELTIEIIAKTVEVHPTHLAREFRRYFQTTIGDFIRQRRIEFACRMIVNSNMPLSEISLEAGFYDQSHFTRIFRKATNLTPAAYRSLFQNR
jgi:AraC family transcriptional regulator